jgi:hypothetical protein
MRKIPEVSSNVSKIAVDMYLIKAATNHCRPTLIIPIRMVVTTPSPTAFLVADEACADALGVGVGVVGVFESKVMKFEPEM